MSKRSARKEEEARLEAAIKKAGPLEYPSRPEEFDQALLDISSGNEDERATAEKLIRKNFDYAVSANKKVEKIWRLFWATNSSVHEFMSLLGIDISKRNTVLSLQQRMDEYLQTYLTDQKILKQAYLKQKTDTFEAVAMAFVAGVTFMGLLLILGFQ